MAGTTAGGMITSCLPECMDSSWTTTSIVNAHRVQLLAYPAGTIILPKLVVRSCIYDLLC
jgi:hypothetical protein